MAKKSNKLERPLDVGTTVKARRKLAQRKISARASPICLKCHTDTELNINGLCAACVSGKRHGSKS